MENNEKQITEELKDPKQVENLPEAELDKVTGGWYSTTKSNIRTGTM